MYDGHSHLDRWSVEVGKREARERLAALPYETVELLLLQMEVGFEEAGLVAHIPGPLKQAFGVHPTEASDTGLTHR